MSTLSPPEAERLEKNLHEASKNARGIFYLYLGTLTYCFLTVVGTSDKQLLLGEKTQLPLINVQVPLYGFFLVAPLLLILIFAYFQLYLQRIKGLRLALENLGELDYLRTYPWMINMAVHSEPGIIGQLQKLVVRALLWWTLPVVLTVFYLWVLKRHEPLLSRALYWESLFGSITVYFFWLHYHKSTRLWRIAFPAALVFLFFGSHLVVGPLWPYLYSGKFGPDSFDPRNLNLSFQSLIQEENLNYPQLPMADLKGINLRWANLQTSILVRADLRASNLQHANLMNANLTGAWLNGSFLDSAILKEARMTGAYLPGASLKNVDLTGAFMDSVNLSFAILKAANLQGTSLTGANLLSADLSHAQLFLARLDNAYLAGANLSDDTLMSASLKKTFLWKARLDRVSAPKAIFDSAILDEASLKGADLHDAKFRYARLGGADLRETNLSYADFTGANLWNADLTDANLMDANLDSADLTKAILTGATIELQALAQTKTLYQAKLDSNILNQIDPKTKVWHLIHDDPNIPPHLNEHGHKMGVQPAFLNFFRPIYLGRDSTPDDTTLWKSAK